jgi:hypothetical protein
VRWFSILLASSIAVAAPAYASGCYRTSIVSPVPFMGNKEVFRTIEGELWRVEYAYLYLYEYYPTVTLCPDEGRLYLGDHAIPVSFVGRAKSGPPASRGMGRRKRP